MDGGWLGRFKIERVIEDTKESLGEISAGKDWGGRCCFWIEDGEGRRGKSESIECVNDDDLVCSSRIHCSKGFSMHQLLH